MKFTLAVFAAIGLTDGKSLTRTSQLKSSMLRNAIPVNADGSVRKLNGDENNNFEISGNNFIAFNDCLSLTWQNFDALATEALAEATAAGSIVPQTSYAIFEVFSKDSGYYQQNSGGELWMLPLADWIQATAMVDDDNDKYCEACQKSYNACYNQDDGNQVEGEQAEGQGAEEQEGEHQEGEQNGGGRKRRFLNGQCEETVDCYICEKNGCFDEGNGEDNQNICGENNQSEDCTFDEESLKQFIEGSAFMETGLYEYDNQDNKLNIWAGFMCNDDGSGIEMAMFADEQCSLYYVEKSFSELMKNTYTYKQLGQASQMIMKPYIDSIDCMECEYKEINQDEEQHEDENRDEDARASETCQNIMQEAFDVDACAGAEANNNGEQNQAADQDADMYIPTVFYTYDFTDGQQPDANDICFYIQELGDFSKKHVFDSGKSGNFFNYKANESNRGGAAAKTFGIVIAVIVAVVAGVLIMQNFNSKRDSKAVPLVGNSKGSMA